jgi:hypothetical protein
MRFDKLTKDNVLMFALKHYENHQATSEKEFYDDMKRFKYLKRLFKKYSKSGIIKERLIMNHIIVLANVFGPDAVKVLLFFKIDQIYWTQLKTFLIFLNYMTADETNLIRWNFVKGIKGNINGKYSNRRFYYISFFETISYTI